WIGADRGAWILLNQKLEVTYALGDFDSIDDAEKVHIQKSAVHFEQYPVEKDETDIEIALQKAFTLKQRAIYLFGMTGGRIDHEIINLQLLYTVVKQEIRGLIIDKNNLIELTLPNEHVVIYDQAYPHISFVPFSQTVGGLTLSNFYYPLV